MSPHESNVAEHLAMAKQLKTKTANYLLTDEEIDMAKSTGRPLLLQTSNTIAYLYSNSEKSAQAEQLLMREPRWIAPSLWKSEFRKVLALYLRKNILTFDEILMIIHLPLAPQK